MSADTKRTEAVLECGGKRSATPLSTATDASKKAASPLRSATAVQDAGFWWRLAWIAAAFCLLVGAAMLYQHSVAAERDPWKSPQLLALKEKLRTTPTDESLRAEIRRLDLEFRQRYFRRLALDNSGAWLLIGGVAGLLLVARSGVKLLARPHLPRRKSTDPQTEIQLAARSRWSVAGLATILLASLVALAFTARSPLPDSATELDKLLGHAPAEDAAAVPSLAELQANWPRFRGFDGSGAIQRELNLAFDVIWKSPVSAPGFNSPVVWGNRVFLSGGDAARREVFCYNATDGRLLWQRAVENVPGSPARLPEISDMTGFAASTMATDGHRVFAMFANADLAAFTFDGSLVWSRNIGVPKNMYGHAASLAIWPGRLVVQLDQDEGAPGGSKLLAFDCTTGRPLWERNKPTHGSWATPIIVEAAGKIQIITLALPFVMSHSLADGNELWRAELMEGEITPSPIYTGGLVMVISPAGSMIALRPDGAGEVTESHVAWKTDRNIPDITSPVSNGELVFTVTTGGSLAAFEIKDGKMIWEKDLELEAQSSPALAGNQLLLVSTKGELISVEAGREFKELRRTKLDDAFHASPALGDGRLFLRGATNVWCLGTK